jgi:hypothetical protein
MEVSDKPLRLSQVLVEECERHFGDSVPSALKAGSADTPEYMAQVYEYLNSRDRWALCLSGGGVRSATFGLGLIQGLAAKGLLARFHYLSTVSGGGYVGSWLSSWAGREGVDGRRLGIEAVQKRLKQARAGAEEPPEIRHLRNYSNYLTPKLGLLSADTWTGLGIYLRNLLLHWLMLIPIFVLPMFVVYVGLRFLRMPVSAGEAWAAFALGAVALFWSIFFVSWNLPSARAWPLVGRLRETREIAAVQGRSQRDFLIFCLLPTLFAAGCLSLALAWFWQQPDPRAQTGWVGELAQAALGPAPPNHRAGAVDSGAWVWQISLLVLAGALCRGLAWGAALWRVRRTNRTIAAADARLEPHHPLSPATALWELLAALIAGAVGGLLVGIAETQVLGDPLQPGAIKVLGNYASPAVRVALYACLAPPMFLLAFLVAESLFIGLTGYFTRDEDREWWGRSGGWMLIAGLGWIGFHGLVLFGPVAIEWLNERIAPAALAEAGGLPGLLSLASGAVAALLGAGSKTPATDRRVQAGVAGGARRLALSAAAMLFIGSMVAGLAWLLLQTLYQVSGGAALVDCPQGARALCYLAGVGVRSGEWTAAYVLAKQQTVGWPALALGFAALLAVGLLAWRSININRFSMHATYRDRLIRCYLGAARGNGNGMKDAENGASARTRLRFPDRFTGFDPNDNRRMAELAEPPAAPGAAPRGPLQVVNMAVNLVNDRMLGWQQRKAASFTVSPLHAGGDILGYRPSAAYGGDQGISLGTAMAVSGAAASPNMGYHSSPVVTLILALFNVRLGWWLGNPRSARPTGLYRTPVYGRDGPVWAVAPLIAECFGQTNRNARFVYLSDGGHFENLGLYEMVRRRCRRIVVSDAGCDPGFRFADLGNAIRKIRVDFGIDIDLEAAQLHPRGDHTASVRREGFYCAIGTIRYPEGEPGLLLYIKPGLYGGEPQDIVNYANENPAYPHEPTADQWFSESQFESYRRLGEHIAEQVFDAVDLESADAEALVRIVAERAKGRVTMEGTEREGDGR